MKKLNMKLRGEGTMHCVEVGDFDLLANDEVLLETQHGQEVGFVLPDCGNSGCDGCGNIDANTGGVTFIRKLSDKDREKIATLKETASKYIDECRVKIEKNNLPMELLDADLSFDEKKVIFYFTAPGRVDFRLLVSDLAHCLKKIIRLQQVGARDEARYMGGVGRCGESVCCKRFLKGNLESVTLDMAADQNLAQMGSNRVTGVCGKLMCCLKYELETYKESKEKMPKIGSEYKAAEGAGIVVGHQPIKDKFSVKLNDNGNIVEVDC